MRLGIDIGGTKLAAALIDKQDVRARRQTASPLHQDWTRLTDSVLDLCGDWFEQVEAIGIACTGLVTEQNVHFVSLGDENAVLPLAARLSEHSGKPVKIRNDADAAALGEARFGGHGDFETLFYITVSTGIGGGMVHRGRLLTSRDGLFAQIAHMTVAVPGSQPCQCGRNNCIEAVASGTAIARRASAILGHTVNARTVLQKYAHTAPIIDLLEECAMALAELMADIRALTGADLFVLGGSVGLSEAFYPKLEKAVSALPRLCQMRLRPASLRSNSGMIGAVTAFGESL